MNIEQYRYLLQILGRLQPGEQRGDWGGERYTLYIIQDTYKYKLIILSINGFVSVGVLTLD